MPARKTATSKPAPAPVSPTPAAPSPAPKAATPSSAKAPVKTPAQAPVKTAARAAAKTTAPPAAKSTKPAKPAKPVKVSKPPKVRQKPVRDSFTMPEADFSLVATLKARALAGQRETKKSELLRAGLHALAAMDSPTLLAALQALEPIKTGRPKKGH